MPARNPAMHHAQVDAAPRVSLLSLCPSRVSEGERVMPEACDNERVRGGHVRDGGPTP